MSCSSLNFVQVVGAASERRGTQVLSQLTPAEKAAQLSREASGTQLVEGPVLAEEGSTHPVLRWLLSTVPTAMIFDDHDISDDWNTSAAWVEHMRRQPWWDERITSGLASYWLYQHLGNLSPDDLDDDPVWPKVRDAGDATRVLREFAFQADREVAGTRWSYRRDFGRVRLVAIDSRCGRVLDGGRRKPEHFGDQRQQPLGVLAVQLVGGIALVEAVADHCVPIADLQRLHRAVGREP